MTKVILQLRAYLVVHLWPD